MKFRNIVGGVLLLFTISACANSPVESGGLLWKISGNGLTSASYLFGTHHLVPVTFLDQIAGLNEAFDAADQVVGELDMSKMNEMQAQILIGSMLPETYSYRSLLNEADFDLLDQKLKDNVGVGLDQLGKMKPAMLNNLLVILEYQKLYPEMTNSISIDQYFQDKATKLSRPVLALESADDQIYALLGHQSIERQLEMLMCMIKHPKLLKEQMDRMQDAYLSQDLNALNQLYMEELPDDPCPSTQAEKDVLNKNRNVRWLEILPDMLREKSSFIAVGCLHLVGEDGLIEGFRKLGYKVEALK